MEHVSIKKLDNSIKTVERAAEIFVDAYFDDLKDISDNKELLISIFARSLIISHFYGAFIDGNMIGIFALSDEKERSIKLDKKQIIKRLGFIKGTIVYTIMKKELEGKIQLNKPGVYIEAVATDPISQGKGIATMMMQYVINNFNHCELDVIDINTSAIRVYTKLGFQVYKEEKAKKNQKYSKKIYMQYDKNV